MVKCIQNCLKFLKFFQRNEARDSKVAQNGSQNHPDALNVTSLHEKEVVLEENQEIQTSIKTYRQVPMSSPSKFINSNQVSPEKPSIVISECNLSPISKRSHSEDFSPVKIPSPTYTARLVPNVFNTGNAEVRPKIYAATPRSRLPKSLKRIMCPLEVS